MASAPNDEGDREFVAARAKFVKDDALHFLAGLEPESVDLVVTDPPYSGMNQHLKLGRGRIVGNYKDRGHHKGKWFQEFHDSTENYEAFLRACHRVLKPNSHIFVMFDAYSMLTLAPIMRCVFAVKNVIVWDKAHIGMGHYFRRRSEFILFGSKGRRPLSRRNVPDVWKMKRITRAPYPTQKPVELFQLMVDSSKPANASSYLVCDPFSGSGSSAVAALKQGATFVGCDISSKAITLARARIARIASTGKDPLQPKSAFVDLGLRVVEAAGR